VLWAIREPFGDGCGGPSGATGTRYLDGYREKPRGFTVQILNGFFAYAERDSKCCLIEKLCCEKWSLGLGFVGGVAGSRLPFPFSTTAFWGAAVMGATRRNRHNGEFLGRYFDPLGQIARVICIILMVAFFLQLV
jgi:hypothetical protein